MNTPIGMIIESIKKDYVGDEIRKDFILAILESQLELEELIIKNAFNSGEHNIFNKQMNGGEYEYQGGIDYFNKLYKK